MIRAIPFGILLLAALAGCGKPQTAESTSASPAATTLAEPPASAVVAESPSIRLSLELQKAVLPHRGPAYFRAALENTGKTPIPYYPGFFEDPRTLESQAGIYLEMRGPNGSAVEREPNLGGSHTGRLEPAQLEMMEDLRKRVEAAAKKARAEGRDESQAIAEATGSTPQAEPRLAPGARIGTAAWHAEGDPAPPTGYSQLPFFLNAPGRYEARLVYDFSARKGAGAERVATRWLPIEVGR